MVNVEWTDELVNDIQTSNLVAQGYKVFKPHVIRPFYINQEGRTMEWYEEEGEWRIWKC